MNSDIINFITYCVGNLSRKLNMKPGEIYALLKYPALANFASKYGFDEVNTLKWNNAAVKIKNVYESVIK